MKMKKRNKLHLLAFMLVAALMMMATMPTVSARAEDEIAFAQVDNIDDEPHELGGCSSRETKKASAYSNLPWYANTRSTVNTGRGVNKIMPNTSATGNHVVYKANTTTGQVTNYAVYTVNPKNPTGFDEKLKYDGIGEAHFNPVTQQYLMPHVHDKTAPGGVRSPHFDEIP